MTAKPSISAQHFEDMFSKTPDPWRFETSPYEAEKYRVTLAALDGRLYGKAFEVGCAIGVLTRELAAHCQSLLSIDVSDTALKKARARCIDLPHVTFDNMVFPKQSPESSFDLVVMSEVVYYWSETDIRAAAHWIDEHLQVGGDLLLAHWTGETDYPQSADNAVRLLRQDLQSCRVVAADRHEEYRLDLWRRV